MAAAVTIKLAMLRLGLAGMAILIPRMLLPVADEPAQSALIAMLYACAAVFALLIFRPSPDTPTIGVLRWCLTVTILFVVILIADPVTRSLLVLLPRIVVTLMLLAATIAIATRRVPMPIAMALFALLTLLPVWAAPAVELAGNPAVFTNAVVAASPLTAFAVALDIDYLRSGWFYANSALGSMRYAYPGWPTLCLLLSLLPVYALLREFVRPPAVSFVRFAKEANP